jgi:hypothetical protein
MGVSKDSPGMGHRLREPDFDDLDQPGYQRHLLDSRSR